MLLNALKKNSTRFILLGLTTVAFLFALRAIADLDIWWHLAAGRWMVNQSSIITKDFLSYTFEGKPWLSITWGYEVILYWLYNFFNQSFAPIAVFHALVAAFSVSFSWMTFKVFKKDDAASNWWAGIIFLATFWILELRWNHRAEMLTYLFSSITLFILARAWRLRSENQKDYKIYFILLVQLLWVNSHGLFPFGPIMVGSFYFSDLVVRKKINSQFLKVFVASLIVCFINPYGVDGFAWPAHLFSVLQDPFFHSAIEETRNALSDKVWLRDAWALVIWLCLIAIQFITIISRADRRIWIKKYGVGYFLSTIVMSWLAISSRRNLSLLVVWTTPQIIDFITEHFKLILNNPKLKGFKFNMRLQAHFGHLTFLASIVIITLCIITNQISDDQSATRFGWGLRAGRFPDRAVQFLVSHATNAKIFSDTQFANYAVFNVPGFRSYMDSRYAEVFSSDHLKLYLAILSQPSFIEQVVDRSQINIVALTFDSASQPLINYLLSDKKWQPVFYDEISVIFSRTSHLQSWLGKEFSPSLSNNFNAAFDRIKNGIPSSRFLDLISVKYKSNDQAWPLIQLIEASLIVGQINAAKKADALANSIAPANFGVQKTHCEAAFFEISTILKTSKLSQNEKNNLCKAGIDACMPALTRGPEIVNLREYVAYFKLNSEQIESATEDFKVLVSLTNRRDLMIHLAEIQIYQKHFKSAYENLEKAQKLQFEPALQQKMQVLSLARDGQ